MTSWNHPIVLVLALALAPAAAQQSNGTARISGWRVPIHTAPSESGGVAYGTWAAGPDYKVSFHDGFTFYPLLGADYEEALPFAWHTESVSIGEREIMGPDAPPCHHHTPWRYEYRYPGVTEAYDVASKGVEQTFVVHARPAGPGDLVVRGVVTSKLLAVPRQASHGAIRFRDGRGEDILEYGAAYVLDAAGRRAPIATSFDGSTISLRVPATWLETATFPVTIDPWTTAVRIRNTFAVSMDVCRDDESNQLLVSLVVAASGGDSDVIALRTTDNFGSPSAVFTDITTGWSTTEAKCVHNSGANRWAIGLERLVGTTASLVRVYWHDHANLTPNSGRLLRITPPSGYHDSSPAIGGTGGSVAGNNVFLAWRRDQANTPTNTARSQVWGCTVELTGTTGRLGTAYRLRTSPSGLLDQEHPAINKQSLGGDWVVVWQEIDYSLGGDDWDILAARIDQTGAHRGIGSFGTTAHVHSLSPIIAGAHGRWLCVFAEQPASGTRIYAQRADWSGTGPMQRGTPRWLGPDATYVPVAIAYDDRTASHWAVTYRIPLAFFEGYRTVRLGQSGCVVESSTRYQAPFLVAAGNRAALDFDRDNGSFVRVINSHWPWTTPGVFGARFKYPDTAKASPYGIGCSGITGVRNNSSSWSPSAGVPHAGSQFFEITLTSAASSYSYGLYLAAMPASVPLGGACELSLGGPLFLATMGTTDTFGRLAFRAPLPDCPVFTGVLYCQWGTVLGGTIRTSRALKLQIQ